VGFCSEITAVLIGSGDGVTAGGGSDGNGGETGLAVGTLAGGGDSGLAEGTLAGGGDGGSGAFAFGTSRA
jgi:hypothetical protein